MMKNLYLCCLLMLLPVFGFGQKQITNFKNEENQSTNTATYQAKTGKKALFTLFTPEYGTELWVSEGSRESTAILKDITPGSNSSYVNDFTEYKGNVYFIAEPNQLWTTNGTSEGTSMVLRSDSTIYINVVNDRLLISFRKGLHSYDQISFAWLTDSGKPEFLDETATAFKAIDNKLFYTPYDSVQRTWALKVFDKEPAFIYQKRGDVPNEIGVDIYKGYEYLSVKENHRQNVLIVANAANRKEAARFYNWGPGPVPATLRDSSGNLFLINDHGGDRKLTLQVYKVISGNSWEKLADIETSALYHGNPTTGLDGPMYSSFSLQGNLLFFTTMYGIEGVNASYLSVFDFKQNTKRLSAKLPYEVTGYISQIQQQSREVFEIRSRGMKCLYDIAKNSPVEIDTLAKPNLRVKLDNNTYEFTDNAYLLSSDKKTPLVDLKATFTGVSFIHQTTFQDQLLLWTYSNREQKSQLWASDGNTTKPLLEYDGYTDTYLADSKMLRIGKNMIFRSYSEGSIKFFVTDGTAQGSRELYNMPTTVTPSAVDAGASKTLAAFQYYLPTKRTLIVTDTKKVYTINLQIFENSNYEILTTPAALYLAHSYTANQKSHRQLFKIENGLLKRLLDDNASDFKTYGNKIYYRVLNIDGTGVALYYLDELGRKVQVHTAVIHGLAIKGRYLLAYRNTGDGTTNFDVLRASSGKVLGTHSLFNDAVASGPFLAVPGAGNITIYHNDEKKAFQLSGDALLPYPARTGFYIQGVKLKDGSDTNIRSSYFYDALKGEMVSISEKDSFNLATSVDSDLLVFTRSGKDRSADFVYNIATRQRMSLPGQPGRITLLGGSLLKFSELYEYEKASIYAPENGVLAEKYIIESNIEPLSIGNSNYLLAYGRGTGFEITRLEKDSIHHFAEIIKGPEGVSLQRMFHYKDGIFAAAFTHSKGLQVWRLGDVSEEPRTEMPEEEEKIIITIPELPGRITHLPDEILVNTYPNPVMHELNVDLKDAGTIQIVDSKGREIIKAAAGRASTIDVKTLPAGHYFLIYTGAGGKITRKIVKL
ncbi:T9SS type A sorting domain-containing protein [Dyadobacter sp. MSC1_007]|jgi:ELWxxDGT repeat protein|uniref:T9SS type A sorting domain-containing protein n=1 Tax=Dyadobacter sp. MSC1_007 TaxID=2909264 RepID=UPI00202EC647|nr:T9SS type A sorting domain-containing protein [Dyadobacter sp. MSC1_007]